MQVGDDPRQGRAHRGGVERGGQHDQREAGQHAVDSPGLQRHVALGERVRSGARTWTGAPSRLPFRDVGPVERRLAWQPVRPGDRREPQTALQLSRAHKCHLSLWAVDTEGHRPGRRSDPVRRASASARSWRPAWRWPARPCGSSRSAATRRHPSTTSRLRLTSRAGPSSATSPARMRSSSSTRRASCGPPRGLAEGPPDEPTIAALRRGSWPSRRPTSSRISSAARPASGWRNPPWPRPQLAYQVRWEDELAREVAADLGVDVTADPRPRIVAHTTVAVNAGRIRGLAAGRVAGLARGYGHHHLRQRRCRPGGHPGHAAAEAGRPPRRRLRYSVVGGVLLGV